MTTTTSTVNERIFDEQTTISTNTDTVKTTETILSIQESSTTVTDSISSSKNNKTPNELVNLVNEAAVSISADGCLLESQADYEFQRCQVCWIDSF